MAHIGPDPAQPGDRLVRAGAVVFAVGVVATVAIVVPFFLGRSDAPLGLVLPTLLMPVGLGIALSGLLRSARRGRR